MATVLDQIEERLGSPFSIHQYLIDTNLFDKVVKKILALKPVGQHALQVNGRFDIASFAIYGTSELDWILMVYNGIKRIGNFTGKDIKRTISLKLSPQQQFVVQVALSHDNLEIVANGVVIPKFLDVEQRTIADADGDGVNDVRITFTATGAVIENTEIVIPSVQLLLANVFSVTADDTITRSSGNFDTDGFTTGQHLIVKGFSNAANNINKVRITNVQPSFLELDTTSLIVESSPITNVEITAVQEPVEFKVVFKELFIDNFLAVGTEIPFPDLTDVEQALDDTNKEEQQSVTGFSRL